MRATATVASFLPLSFTLALLTPGAAAPQAGFSDQEVRAYTLNLPFPMPEVQLPKIPDHRVSITDFGALSDGHTMNTKPINDAIRACAKQGGGTVVIPPGVWLTGPIQLDSNIELRVEAGALVLFSGKFEDYPMFARPRSTSYRCTPLIYGVRLSNVAITGKGAFNGNGQHWRPTKKEKLTERQWKELIGSDGVVSPDGKIWWPSREALNGDQYVKNLRQGKKRLTPEEFAGAREFLRPTMVELINCTSVLIDGPTFTNSPAWVLHPMECKDVVIRNTSVINDWWGQNTDAADIDACRNVVFYRNVLDAGDDAICMKSGTRGDGSRAESALENVVIADCIVYHGHGGFVIGSGTDGGVRNISVKNCTFMGTDIGLRFKTARDRGGVVEKIFVDGIRMKDIGNEAILFDMSYTGNNDYDSTRVSIPHFRDFDIKNIVCDGATDAVRIRGLADAPIQRIALKNLSITSRRAVSLEDAESISLTDVWLDFKFGPVLSVKNCRDVQAERVTLASRAGVFVRASGAKTEAITALKKDAAQAKRELELVSGTDSAAVIFK
jgi:DNA sulfur modification protein DndE